MAPIDTRWTSKAVSKQTDTTDELMAINSDDSDKSSAPHAGWALLFSAWAIALAASLGNVLSQHALTHLPVVQVNAWGMTYGALFNLLVCLVLGREFNFDPSVPYIGSMAFLVMGGSIAAFVLYLTLIERMGANRAGYTVVAFPVVATLLAVIFEGLAVTGWLIAGMVLVLLGNVLILNQSKKRPSASGSFSGNEKSA